jgi:hypothetical protein
MRTNLKKLMMPLAVIIVGSFGAFATMSMGSVKPLPTDQRGYLFVDALHPCVQNIICSTIVNDICKTPSLQTLTGKINENDASCPQTLYKK